MEHLLPVVVVMTSLIILLAIFFVVLIKSVVVSLSTLTELVALRTGIVLLRVALLLSP